MYRYTNPVKDFFPEYTITLEPGEREEILKQIGADAEEINQGLTMKNPGLVSHIATDKNYLINQSHWYCKTCPYREQCVAYRVDSGEIRNKVEELLARM